MKKPSSAPRATPPPEAPPARMVTYADIAKKAGVSRMTVSLALRNHPDVSKATGDKVLAVAAALGYRPDPEINRLMSYLRTSRESRAQHVIAFLDPWPREKGIPDRFHLDLLYQGVKKRCAELGFRADVLWLKEPGMTQRRMNSILYTRGIRGLLIPPLPTGRGHITFEWNKFSCVVMDDVMKPDLHRVTADQFGNAQMAFRSLRKLGYRRVGFVATRFLDEKVDHAYSAAFYWHNAQVKSAERLPPLILDEYSPEAIRKYVARHRAEVLVSMMNEKELQRSGFKIPDEVALASLYTTRMDASLAGINPLSPLQGEAAVDLLVSLLLRNEVGVPKNFHHLRIRGKWLNGTTAPGVH